MERNIKILPIFNQSAPGVWQDFGRIKSATMRANYDHIIDDSKIQATIESDARKWRRGTHFAFGAYDGDKMIGFIQGDATGRCATIQSLYVLHEYQKMRLGTRLLYSAENAVMPLVNRVELISWGGAMPFYERNGYKSLVGSNEYTKKLNAGTSIRVVPVFRCNINIARECGKIAQITGQDFNAAQINANHTPMFIFQMVNGKIAGYAVGDGDYNVSQLCVGTDFCPDWMRTKLRAAFNELAVQRAVCTR